MKKTVAVLGLGLFGSSVAKTLAKNGVDVIALDLQMDHVEEVMDDVELPVQADFTKIDQLINAGVGDADVAIIGVGEKLEITILGIMNLKKLGVKEVIVKTKNQAYKEVLMKVGATRVILPEVESGVRLGNELASSNIVDLLQLDEDYHILEINIPEDWIGHSILELDIRTKYGYNIIAIKSIATHTFLAQIDPGYVFKEKDVVLVMAQNTLIE
ncbi:MAG: TrkA family potassium uptake protein [Erysipelothrix sp.]|nr:TrkA family potassium uptake protein [Erysipelothrix sp.]